MRLETSEQASWAKEEFGSAELGDTRRTARVINMATRAAERPAGKVSAVFARDKERQGAYCLLEGGQVEAEELVKAAGRAAARRAKRERFAFLAVDGSSVSLVDQTGTKDFGSVGNLAKQGRGLKVINALGMSPEGMPLGMFAQSWWARTSAKTRTKQEKKNHARRREAKAKETRHWLTAIEDSAARANETGASLWFLLDREGDGQDVLLKLADINHRFTVRSSSNRRLESDAENVQYLHDSLEQEQARGEYFLEVPSGPNRSGRTARMVVCWQPVVLSLRDGKNGRLFRQLPLRVVWTHEEGTCPPGEAPLNWRLLTNSPVTTFEDAQQIINGYTQRWRIEELHKTWKSGACNVEQTQLRTKQAVTVWATILCSVAVRIERLKLLSRTKPEEPASIEFTEPEIRALIILKRENKKRNEVIPDAVPTIEQATRWVAELGGYTGRSSGGPPGSITIRRGLEVLAPAAQVYAAMGPPTKCD